jgi:hypothetical protein
MRPYFPNFGVFKMTIKVKQINDIGYNLIKKWVTETHWTQETPDERAMEYWCRDAEEGLVDNDSIIEMKAANTLSGRTETFTIPPQGISVYEVDD